MCGMLQPLTQTIKAASIDNDGVHRQYLCADHSTVQWGKLEMGHNYTFFRLGFD